MVNKLVQPKELRTYKTVNGTVVEIYRGVYLDNGVSPKGTRFFGMVKMAAGWRTCTWNETGRCHVQDFTPEFDLVEEVGPIQL